MKYVGKRKVFISALALMLALVCTGAAFADSYPSPVFFLPSVNSRPEATTAPEETVLPEESAAPEETASPEATAAPEETASPEATDAPEETADPEATAAPEETVDPEATAAPEETASPEVTATPEATIDPNAATTLEPSSEATEDPTPTTTPEPTVEPTPAPTISYWRDEAGNLILDVNGMPVPIVPEGMQAPSEYLRNEYGAFVLDENGNPIPVAAELTPEPTLEPQPTPAFSFTYERDEAGSLILDANGNPIAILTEGMTEMPVAFQHDESGTLVLDADGNPIPTKLVPCGSQILVTIEDVLDPNRSVDIYAAWDGDTLYFGSEARLIAVMNGYDEVVYSLQWQTSKDGVAWTDVEGATETEHRMIVTEENYLDYWRVAITITDVTEQARQEYLENNQQ